MTLRDRINSLMTAKGIDNYRSLSKLSGASERVLSILWSGEENVDLRTLKILCVFFNISVDFLVFGNEAIKRKMSVQEGSSVAPKDLHEEREALRQELQRLSKRLRELDSQLDVKSNN